MGLLKDLHIGSYRSLRAIRLEQLGRVNLVVGGNNTGKTSVLEAVGLVARPLDPAQWIQTAKNRDSSGSPVDGLWGLFPEAHAFNIESEEERSNSIEIRALFDEARQLTAYADAFTETWTDVDRAGIESQTDTLVRVHITVSLDGHPVPVLHEMDFGTTRDRIPVGHGVPFVRAFVVTPITHRSTQQLITYLSHVIDLGAKERCVQLLQSFDDAVEDVEISRPSDRSAIRVSHKKRGVVDLATFGDGMRRAFAMSLALMRASGGVLLIDEMESAIHARALDSILPWLVRAADEVDVQVIASTHSLEMVDAVLSAFSEAEPSRMITYHLRKTGAGHQCRRYDLAELRLLRNEGLDIR